MKVDFLDPAENELLEAIGYYCTGPRNPGKIDWRRMNVERQRTLGLVRTGASAGRTAPALLLTSESNCLTM